MWFVYSRRYYLKSKEATTLLSPKHECKGLSPVPPAGRGRPINRSDNILAASPGRREKEADGRRAAKMAAAASPRSPPASLAEPKVAFRLEIAAQVACK